MQSSWYEEGEIELNRFFALVSDRIAYEPSSTRPVLVRVFAGGDGSEQLIPFRSAIGSLGGRFRRSNYHFEYIKGSELKGWTPEQFAEWLLSSHYHFIICHPHQWMKELGWNVDSIYRELQRLRFHPGFPSGDKLRCPIFTQDKIRYIRAMEPFQMCIPTFQCTVSYGGAKGVEFSDDVKDKLKIFLDEHLTFKKEEFVVKAPYTCNSHWVKYCHSIVAVDRALEMFLEDFDGRIPYVLVQPLLPNKCEYKVIVQEGKFKYIGSIASKKNGYAFGQPNDIRKFAEQAVLLLSRQCSCAIVDGTVRVDIMHYNGRYVVNEFESLEAGICAIKQEDFLNAKKKQHQYWHNILHNLFKCG